MWPLLANLHRTRGIKLFQFAMQFLQNTIWILVFFVVESKKLRASWKGKLWKTWEFIHSIQDMIVYTAILRFSNTVVSKSAYQSAQYRLVEMLSELRARHQIQNVQLQVRQCSLSSNDCLTTTTKQIIRLMTMFQEKKRHRHTISRWTRLASTSCPTAYGSTTSISSNQCNIN